MANPMLLLLLLISVANFLRPSTSQSLPAAQPSNLTTCNGIFINYLFENRQKIHPFVSEPTKQPYSFGANVTLLNSGTIVLKAWTLVIGFSHLEILVSISNAVLADGSALPFQSDPKTPVEFSGFPNPDLKTPIATAGDLSQIQTSVSIIGTQFGVSNPAIPLPSTLSLSDPAWTCPPAAIDRSNRSISTCCVQNLDPSTNSTLNDNSTLADENFLPRRAGDLSITYDVIQAFPSSYLALVTIENESPLGRLDNWRLSWEWMRGEFINSIRGAYTSLVSSSDCIFGKQGEFYKDLDFSKVVNCQKIPTILDLPSSMANDNDLGKIPSCCRNGTILPKSMDASQSASAFQLQVYKMPPDDNRTILNPPQNWHITGVTLNPDYTCGAPIRVAPSKFPDPSGLQSNSSAIASWQVICNISQPKNSKPKCCVSFSAYYNDSAVPCKTCACGCPASSLSRTCNATAPALLLPPDALLVPFDNRSAKALAWAEIKHLAVPKPMPCGDFCGVSVNWHINTDYGKGWTARVTLFNWDDVSLANWFMAVEMPKAYDGFEAMYSFNATAIGKDTIFMQGLPGLNYLMGEVDGSNPASDPRVPGKQQSVISFTKSKTPGINVPSGDGYPSKVFFNGEECSLPDMIPTGGASRIGGEGRVSMVLILLATVFVLFGQ
ncbi:COBRA-like protein 7 [Dendrobium catenatum]|uniref:COBRA-like protein 7 n=1 Tax=Dendrobium catenatum TaxID=906689 RepID=A0A2I0WVA1_9ASPA|nr:COBRA-like protein 7 [Dendrobium catenatum]PKU79584.1 COBRA-like protein 7 [Dendrobium catenatum]